MHLSIEHLCYICWWRNLPYTLPIIRRFSWMIEGFRGLSPLFILSKYHMIILTLFSVILVTIYWRWREREKMCRDKLLRTSTRYMYKKTAFFATVNMIEDEWIEKNVSFNWNVVRSANTWRICVNISWWVASTTRRARRREIKRRNDKL